MPVLYDPFHPDLDAVRQIFFDMLRANPNIEELPSGAVYDPFVIYSGNDRRPEILAFHVLEVFWRLVVEGILTPGSIGVGRSPNAPWFHLTSYGAKVLKAEAGHPYDQAGYLTNIRARIPDPDRTVLAYLAEALASFHRGAAVATTILVGIAAERVFLLVCESLLASLRDPNEKTRLEKLRFVKPKLDWVHRKIEEIQARKVPEFPENATLMVTALYDLLRTQRNDLGHPRELPPSVDLAEAYDSLQVFPGFYRTAEELRRFLGTNQA